MNNDFLVFRFAEVWLMKAEVILRKGGSATDVLTIVNNICASRNAAALNAITPDGLYGERGRELAWEGWRRKWESSFGYNPGGQPATRRLFPIPAARIGANPSLQQNPGY